MKHINKGRCDDKNCNGSCVECCCFVCEICGLYEGALTTDCPESRQNVGKTFGDYAIVMDEIYKGNIDFKEGQWVLGTSIHSPAR